MSDTPRTDDAYFKAGATMYDMAGEMKRMERELNAASDRIKRLEGELESTKADRDSWSNQSDEFAKTAADLIIRIKRLEEAGDAMVAHAKALGMEGTGLVKRWNKAKEAKP